MGKQPAGGEESMQKGIEININATCGLARGFWHLSENGEAAVSTSPLVESDQWEN
jgi:hypothetical protein